jgi:hypothetical protein
MIFSGVDDLGDRLVVDAQIRRDAVQRRSLSVCRHDRRDDRYGLRGRTCIDLQKPGAEDLHGPSLDIPLMPRIRGDTKCVGHAAIASESCASRRFTVIDWRQWRWRLCMRRLT